MRLQTVSVRARSRLKARPPSRHTSQGCEQLYRTCASKSTIFLQRKIKSPFASRLRVDTAGKDWACRPPAAESTLPAWQLYASQTEKLLRPGTIWTISNY